MEVIKTGQLINLEGNLNFDTFKLILNNGAEITGIIPLDKIPLFSIGDFLNIIEGDKGGKTYESILKDAKAYFKFTNKRIGTFVSIDALIRYSSRVRGNLNNEFFLEIVELVQKQLFR